MGMFENAITRMFDNSRQRALSLFDEMESRFGRFSLDATVDSLIDYSLGVCDTLAEFGRTVKETVSDFKLVIPFDEKTETFEFDVKDGELEVRVNGKNSHRRISSTIPQNCILDEMHHVVNHKKNLLIVIIPKDLSNDENLQKLKANVIEKVTKATDTIVNTVKEKTNPTKEVETVEQPKPKKAEPLKTDSSGKVTGSVKVTTKKNQPKPKKKKVSPKKKETKE